MRQFKANFIVIVIIYLCTVGSYRPSHKARLAHHICKLMCMF